MQPPKVHSKLKMSYYPAAYPQWPINCNCFNLHSDESEEEKRQCAKDSKLVYSDDSLTSVECDIPDELFEKYLTARKKRIFRGEIKKTAFEERCLKAAFIMKQVHL